MRGDALLRAIFRGRAGEEHRFRHAGSVDVEEIAFDGRAWMQVDIQHLQMPHSFAADVCAPARDAAAITATDCRNSRRPIPCLIVFLHSRSIGDL